MSDKLFVISSVANPSLVWDLGTDGVSRFIILRRRTGSVTQKWKIRNENQFTHITTFSHPQGVFQPSNMYPKAEDAIIAGPNNHPWVLSKLSEGVYRVSDGFYGLFATARVSMENANLIVDHEKPNDITQLWRLEPVS